MKLNHLKRCNPETNNFRSEGYFRTGFAKIDATPYCIYAILKSYFGEPNANTDDSKSQWYWEFIYEEMIVEIYDWKYDRVSIGVYCKKNENKQGEIAAEKIKNSLENLANQKRSLIKDKIKQSNRKIIQNPFITYYSTAIELLAINDMIENHNKILSHSWLRNSLDLDNPMDGIEEIPTDGEHYRSAFLMLLASFEGFLNVVYEICIKPELRNERFYSKIGREDIDIKLRMIPVYCTGFKDEILDGHDERFKNLMKLVNLRNDYVHANLIKSLERRIIQEDGFMFILDHEENQEIPSNISRLNRQHLEVAKKYIDDAVKYVLESMKPKTRREFTKAIYEPAIEIEEEDGTYFICQ